jgi:hypothetical protein
MKKQDILNKYGILSKYNLKKINEDKEGFKDFIKSLRRISRFHGFFEMTGGSTICYVMSNMQTTDETTLVGYAFLTLGYAFGTYTAVEGAIDLITGQRKHHLTSTILEKFGLHRANYHLSAAKASELEKLIE